MTYYAVKVGEYYVNEFDLVTHKISLSKEIMRGFLKDWAKKIAKQVDGTIIAINWEDKK